MAKFLFKTDNLSFILKMLKYKSALYTLIQQNAINKASTILCKQIFFWRTQYLFETRTVGEKQVEHYMYVVKLIFSVSFYLQSFALMNKSFRMLEH